MKSINQLVRGVLPALLVALVATATASAKSQQVEWQTYSQAQLMAAMKTLGVGGHARVIVTLQDGTKLTGYVSQSDDTHFVVVVKGQATPVPYDQVFDIRAGNPDTQVKFAARITSEAGAIAAETPPPPQVQHPHPKLSAAAKATLILGLMAAGIVASLAAAGKL